MLKYLIGPLLKTVIGSCGFLLPPLWLYRGGCRGLPLLPMQHPEMAHINFQSSVFVSKKTVNKILKLDQD